MTTSRQARRSDWRRAGALIGPAYLWLMTLIFVPLSAMLFFSFLSEAPFGNRDWEFTLTHYREFFARRYYADLLWRSLALGATVTFFCLLIGYPCAYILAKKIKGRSREALFLLVILPFWSNGLARVFAWVIVLRGNGVLNAALDFILPFKVSVNLMFTHSAVVIGLVHSYLPYAILTAYLALQDVDEALIEAARSMGAPLSMIMRRIIFPLSLPGVIAGAVLIFAPVVGSFMEPRILGGKQGMFYGTVIEDQFVAVFNWPLGAALSFILLIVALICLALAGPALKKWQ